MARLTLTFDNGPVPGATGRIVDLLAARGHRATFFVVGDRLADPAARREAERACRQGHLIGNHTMTHSGPLGERTDPGHAKAEIEETQRMIGDLAGDERLFRPVGGGGKLGKHLLSAEAANFLIANAYTMVTWNNVPRDWVAPGEDWVERALAEMVATEWTLLVLHDHCLGEMMPTLSGFLDRVEKQNVEIVQEFPDCCVPIREGRAGDLAAFVNAG